MDVVGALRVVSRSSTGKKRSRRVGDLGPDNFHGALCGRPVFLSAWGSDDDRGRTRIRYAMGLGVFANRRRRWRVGRIRRGAMAREILRRENRGRAFPRRHEKDRKARLPDNFLSANGT